MSAPLTAPAVLDRVYLEVRCKLLDIAASLDRISRSEGAGTAEADPRMAQLLRGLEILGQGGTDRAEQIQMLFSDAYVPNWSRKN
ncbi:MAG: hypothetical protein JSS02_29665 [Planctomycetes bacterium]|nr:hypothetical protein [Planctomycetota bacterium]